MNIPAKARGLVLLRDLGLPALDFRLLPDGSAVSSGDLRGALQQAACELGQRPFGFSLRSAAWSEDGLRASRAGQLISFNGLAGDDLLPAALAIWRHRDRVLPGETCFLILQHTHPSYVSGVAAIVPERDVMLECSFGSCRNVTDGLVQPTRVTYDVVSGETTIHAHETREAALLWAHRSLFADERTKVPGMRLRPRVQPFIERPRLLGGGAGAEILVYGRPPAIGPEVIDRIVASAAEAERRIRRLGGSDLEWAVNRDGEVVFLQLRPLTRPIASIAVVAADGAATAGMIQGVAASPGTAVGEVMYGWPSSEGNYIVAIGDTTVHDIAVLRRATGLMSLTGGMLSHIAIVCRELGIPYVANLPTFPPAGQRVRIDGSQGAIKILTPGG